MITSLGVHPANHRYRREMAQGLARLAAEPDSLADHFEAHCVTIDSLQTEWLRAGLGAIASTRRPLGEEGLSVMRDVAARVRELAGQQMRQLCLQAVQISGQTGNWLSGLVVGSEPGQFFLVGLHDTPGQPGGLMMVAPVTAEVLGYTECELRRPPLGRVLALDDLEAGWQLSDRRQP